RGGPGGWADGGPRGGAGRGGRGGGAAGGGGGGPADGVPLRGAGRGVPASEAARRGAGGPADGMPLSGAGRGVPASEAARRGAGGPADGMPLSGAGRGVPASEAARRGAGGPADGMPLSGAGRGVPASEAARRGAGGPADGFKDECGVFGIYSHPEAANLTYLGLYALQHRGQESVGIASSDGARLKVHRAMGYVADAFNETQMSELSGNAAVGHVRYSTAGESGLKNAQPILIDCAHGEIAVCHNGNLVNALELRDQLVRQGSIFQTTSDTEVLLHLYARSKGETVEAALMESLAQVRGAFSLVLMTNDRVVAVRDPHGFRPLAIGALG